jgi:hypothetical protein
MGNTIHPRKAHYFAYQLSSKAKFTLATYQYLAITGRKFTEMPMTEAVMKQIKKWVMKDHAQNGHSFKNRNGEEYKYNDNEEDTPIVHPENAPFPDIPVEAPRILTKQEETQEVNAIRAMKNEPY